MWEAYRKGIMPNGGGWLDQPLSLIMTFDAMDLIYDAEMYMQQENASMSKLSAEQHAIRGWLNN